MAEDGGLPSGTSRGFGYDAAGNLLRRTDRRGTSVTFTYDSAGRVATRTADGIVTTCGYGPAATPWASATNTLTNDTIRYDLLGRAIEEVSYFAGNRYGRSTQCLREGVVSQKLSSFPGITFSPYVTFGYDNALRMSWMQASGDYGLTQFTYNGDG